MAVNIFGYRMDDNISSMVERILDVWRQESVINHHKNSMLMRNVCNGTDVHQRQCGVAWGLDPDKLGVWANHGFCVDFDGARERHTNTVGSCNLCEVTMGTAIDITDGDDMTASCQTLKNCSSGCRSG